jgi:7-cyano-7-deazaguanine reductase
MDSSVFRSAPVDLVMSDNHTPANSPLGKPTAYRDTYDPTLLFPIPREENRNKLGLSGTLPFFGMDVWNAYELSWLNMRGKPQVAIATLIVPADTPNIVESKSMKLYFNSLNQSKIAGPDALQDLLRADLSSAFGGNIQLKLVEAADFAKLQMGEPEGLLLDRLDIEVDRYEPDTALLTVTTDEAPIEETLISHLLKSNCPVTNQPDWASVQIRYAGHPINQEGLLRYLIGFRQHQGFHEHCVETIFMDILRRCAPLKLMVSARYCRRGGIDINPWRANFPLTKMPSNDRGARQ